MPTPLIARLLIVGCVALSAMFPATGTVYAQEPPPPELQAAAPDAQTAYLSIPAAAFVPARSDADYENHGRYLKNKASSTQIFRTAVQLPHGATVTRLSACFYDQSETEGATLELYHFSTGTQTTEMAWVGIIGAGGYAVLSDDSITEPVIFAYYRYYALELVLPGNSAETVWSCGATIEYIPPAGASHYVSLAAAGLRAMEDGYNGAIARQPTYLHHFSRPDGSATPGEYLLPVRLPHGAVVTTLGMTYTDQNAERNLNVHLQRAPANNPSSYATLASVSSAVMAGEGILANTLDITNPTIDNLNYTYWVYLELPQWQGTLGNQVSVYGIQLIYTPPAAAAGKIALSNADFIGFHEGFDFENHARWLYHLHSEGGGSSGGVYLAPLHLPDRTRITNLWATLYDGSATLNGSAYLARTRLGGGNNEVIAQVTSSGSGGYTTYNDTWLAENSLVDNARFAYYVYWTLPVSDDADLPDADDVVGVAVRVEYGEVQHLYLPLLYKPPVTVN